MKFRDLYSYAQEIKADALITGHYVNRIKKNGNASLHHAKCSGPWEVLITYAALLGAGGKPSTWLPPGGLVEQEFLHFFHYFTINIH